MKKFLPIIAFFSLTAGYAAYQVNEAYAKCTGSSNCKACKSCKACKYCAKDGGTCGVCAK